MVKKQASHVVATQQALLVAVVKNKGSGARVAKELRCSQQSVSAWARGTWLPRPDVQKRMLKRYGIPMPWVLPQVEA